MNPELSRSDDTAEAENIKLEVEVNSETLGEKRLSTENFNAQWQQVGEKIADFLDKMPSYIGNFFKSYSRPLITVGLIFASLITLKLTLALLDAIDDLPLLDSTLNLIGLGYTIWFINRYLLRASSRQELSEEINSFKDQYLGRGNLDS